MRSFVIAPTPARNKKMMLLYRPEILINILMPSKLFEN